MFKNYIKITIRNFLKYKTYSFINIFGLAVGIACCLLIIFYVQNELSFDKFHPNSDRICRALWKIRFGGRNETISSTQAIIAPLFTREFPEVESSVRLYNRSFFGQVVVSFEDKKFLEQGFAYADSTFFSIFNFPLLAGDPNAALTRPNTIVLSHSVSTKLFGQENPIGKILKADGTEYEVSGVMQDMPTNSHINFDYIASWTSLKNWQSANEEVVGPANFATYFLLNDSDALTSVQAKIPSLIQRLSGEDTGSSYALQPLEEIHLFSADVRSDYAIKGDIVYVYGFSAIAGLILLVACINYMNLATARSSRRAKEVGVRKVVGANRSLLAQQFLGESFLITILSLAIAIGLVELSLPFFQNLIGAELKVSYLDNLNTVFIITSIALIVSFVSGSYPALVMSGFHPAHVLKGEVQKGAKGVLFRKVLVVFQFSVSLFLIVGTVIVNNQLDYVRNKKLGFQKEQVLVLPIDSQVSTNSEVFKAALLQHSQIISATAVNNIPGKVLGGYKVQAEGLLPEEHPSMTGWIVDTDFVETLELDLLQGRDFSKAPANREDYDYILNETGIRKIGWSNEEALGKALNLHGRKGRVIGVVKDFHYASLHHPIEPLILFIEPDEFDFLLLETQMTDLQTTLEFLKEQWAKFAPHRPFEFSFLDQEFDALYNSEIQVQQFFTIFSVLAIFIACLGLFGLSAFTAEQRTKEVGIRKVLGATVSSLILLLSKEFTKFVLLAILIASPVAYLIMNSWLQNFAYQIEVGFFTFIMGGFFALLVSLLTVSYQAARAALANPVNALKYE